MKQPDPKTASTASIRRYWNGFQSWCDAIFALCDRLDEAKQEIERLKDDLAKVCNERDCK